MGKKGATQVSMWVQSRTHLLTQGARGCSVKTCTHGRRGFAGETSIMTGRQDGGATQSGGCNSRGRILYFPSQSVGRLIREIRGDAHRHQPCVVFAALFNGV